MFMERFNLTQHIKPHKMNNTDHEWTHVLARGKQLLHLISNKTNNTNKTLAVPQTTGYKIEPTSLYVVIVINITTRNNENIDTY